MTKSPALLVVWYVLSSEDNEESLRKDQRPVNGRAVSSTVVVEKVTFGDVELTLISAWSIAINASDELVGLWTVSDNVWFVGWRLLYVANRVIPGEEGVTVGLVRPSS